MKYNYAISLTDIWHSGNFPNQNGDSMWKVAGYITIERDWAPTVFFLCLYNIAFQIVNCYRRKVGNNTIKMLHSIATQINIGRYWPHYDVTLFPTPSWNWNALLLILLGVIISTEVWYVAINRLDFKTSSLTELKFMAFHYANTCFKRIIISRTEYSFLSKQPVKSVRKTVGFLSLNRISELIWDNESYERRAPSDSSSEDQESF